MKISHFLHTLLTNFNLPQHHTKNSLYLAVEANDVDLVRDALKKDSSYSTINAIFIPDDGVGPTTSVFSLACEKGNKKIINLLLDTQEVNINWKDASGTSSFLIACEHCDMSTVQDILDKAKPDIHLVDKNGRNSIIVLSSRSQLLNNEAKSVVQMIDQLINLGVNYHHVQKNLSSKTQDISKHKKAISSWQNEMNDKFIDRGIENSFSYKKNDGNNAFNHAIYAFNIELMEYFIYKTNIDKTLSLHGRNALCDAVLIPDENDESNKIRFKRAKVLIDAGFDLKDIWIYTGGPVRDLDSFKIAQDIQDYNNSTYEKIHLDKMFSTSEKETQVEKTTLGSKIQQLRQNEVLENEVIENKEPEIKVSRKKI
jgi:nitrate reductase NapAB chaperone NapD